LANVQNAICIPLCHDKNLTQKTNGYKKYFFQVI